MICRSKPVFSLQLLMVRSHQVPPDPYAPGAASAPRGPDVQLAPAWQTSDKYWLLVSRNPWYLKCIWMTWPFLYLQAPNTSNICKSFTRNGNLLGLHIFGTYHWKTENCVYVYTRTFGTTIDSLDSGPILCHLGCTRPIWNNSWDKLATPSTRV